MDSKFWKEGWEEGRTAFHQVDGNPEFAKYLESLGERIPQSKFFFPLCGKTRDMDRVYQLGGEILGVEFSPLAIESYFKESEINFEVQKMEVFELYKAQKHLLFCGDFFKLTNKHLKEVTHLFDRASFIALPEELRKRYANHFKNILPTGVSGFMGLLTYDCEDKTMGPPFSISVSEMKELFYWVKDIKLTSQKRAEKGNVFADRGVEWMEHRYFEIQYT